MVGMALWTAYLWYDSRRDDLPPPEISGPPELRTVPREIISDQAHERRAAEERVIDLLLDPIRADTGFRVSRLKRMTGTDWINGWGGPRLVDALLSRYEGVGLAESRADVILSGLARRYPQLAENDSIAFEAMRRAPQEELTYTIALAMSNGGVRGAGYLLYRLEQDEAAPDAVTAACLLRYLATLPAEDCRLDRTLRILGRIPDRRLSAIVARLANRVDTVSVGWQALMADRAGRESEFVDLIDWSRRDDLELRRKDRLNTHLDGSDLILKRAALRRLSWDPCPTLDVRVLDLARRGDPPEVRLDALRALSAIPSRASVTTLMQALEEPSTRDVAAWGLARLTGISFGTDATNWNLDQTVLSEHDELEQLSRTLAELANELQPRDLRARLVSTSEVEVASAMTLLPLMARRGELKASFGDLVEAWVARLVDPSPDVRSRAWRGLDSWSTPPAIVVIDAARRETEPETRRVILDHLVMSTPENEVEARLTSVVAAIAADQQFRGLSIGQAFALSHRPTIVELTLSKLGQSSDAATRTAALYLISGLTPGVISLDSDTIETLVRALRDGEERVRFWAHTALLAVTEHEFGYDSQLSPRANLEAIESWKAWLDDR